MALSIYCMQCGQPSFYTTAKPRLCGHCGSVYETSAAVAPKPKPSLSNLATTEITRILNKEKKPGGLLRNQELDIELEDDESTEIPQMNGLDVEISVAKCKGIKLGDIGKEQKIGLDPRPKPKKTNKKQFLEEWQKEAGPRRPGQSTEIGGSE